MPTSHNRWSVSDLRTAHRLGGRRTSGRTARRAPQPLRAWRPSIRPALRTSGVKSRRSSGPRSRSRTSARPWGPVGSVAATTGLW